MLQKLLGENDGTLTNTIRNEQSLLLQNKSAKQLKKVNYAHLHLYDERRKGKCEKSEEQ